MSLTARPNATGGSSGPAVKTWVNAMISITPERVQRGQRSRTPSSRPSIKDAGNGAGLVPAAGETVTVTLTPTRTARPTPAGPFTGTTDADGHVRGDIHVGLRRAP